MESDYANKNHLVLGQGGAGKDTVSEILCELIGIKKAKGTSEVICTLKSKELGISEKVLYGVRHDNRPLLKKWGTEYCQQFGGSYLLQEAFKTGQVANGCRRVVELFDTPDYLIDCVWWIHCENVPEDSTMEITIEDILQYCRKYNKELFIVVNNHDSDPERGEKELRKKLTKHLGTHEIIG